jgi:hypothetical protein
MKHKGGSEAKGGFYWKKGEWEIVTVDGKSGTLPGTNEVEYVRVPGLLVVPVALVVSITYVIFLPVIGFAMLFHALAGKVAERVRSRARAPVLVLERVVMPENLVPVTVEAEDPVEGTDAIETGDLVGAGARDKWVE